MDRLQYLLLMGACVLVTLPLELVLRCPGVAVSRAGWSVALLPAFGLFVVWDLWATSHGHLGLQPRLHRRPHAPGRDGHRGARVLHRHPVCGLLTLETVRSILRPRGVGLMPIYPTLAVTAAVVVLAAGAPRAALRAVPRPGVLDLDGDLLRVHDPGGRVAHEALGADRRSTGPRTPAASPRSGTSRWRSTPTPSRCSRW